MQATIEELHIPDERNQILSKFLELSGYGDHDILAINWKTSTFLTRNRGLYRMVGEQILHLDGPSPDPEDRL